jgi:mono/diheme cytochrome c family protein
MGIAAMGTLASAQGAKAEAGKQLYATQKCATCHQIAGVGGKLASALDGVGAKLTEADIRKWMTAPAQMEAALKTKPKMPMSTYMKSKKLSDADIDALVAYMMSLK